jgi:hypothetical protein
MIALYQGATWKKEFSMKNLKFLGIIALVAVIGFAMTACGDGGGGGGGGSSGTFAALVGDWGKDTGQKLNAVDNSDSGYSDQNLSFYIPNSSASYGDLYFRVRSYSSSKAVLKDIYSELDDLTITITVTGTTLTISGFTGSRSDGVDLTQFNGTYTKQ